MFFHSRTFTFQIINCSRCYITIMVIHMWWKFIEWSIAIMIIIKKSLNTWIIRSSTNQTLQTQVFFAMCRFNKCSRHFLNSTRTESCIRTFIYQEIEWRKETWVSMEHDVHFYLQMNSIHYTNENWLCCYLNPYKIYFYSMSASMISTTYVA